VVADLLLVVGRLAGRGVFFGSAAGYADFALWQRKWLRGEVLEEQLDYWRQQLADVPTLELPTDRPRPAVQTHKGAIH
jgi:Condensation domain